VAPPRRGAAEPEQARGLGGDAVRGHELLLLAHRADEPERVPAEADEADRHERQQPERRRPGHRGSLAQPRWREHQERQQQPRGDLHADARGERQGRCAVAGHGLGAQRERQRDREQDQRVVVRAAHRHREQHGVQADERDGPPRAVPQASRRAPDQRDRGQARTDRQRLEGPQPRGEPQRRREIAGEREEGAVGGVLEGPADELVDLIARGFGGEVRVGVQPVQRAHAGEGHVAEDVLGKQRRPKQQDHVGGHDSRRDRARRERAGADEHERVAGAHQQEQRLEAFV